MGSITFFRSWIWFALLISSLIAYSCKQEDPVVNPTPSIPPVSQITDVMKKELPTDALKRISDAQQTQFTSVAKSYFTANSTTEDVIKKINELSTISHPVGQVLAPLITSPRGAREGNDGNEDPPGSRRVTFYSNSSAWNAFDGQVNIRYGRDSDGNATGFSYSSNVTISAVGVNFGNYTQTGITTSTYKTSDGSTVVVFEITGTYTPPLIGLTGASNNWVFTGYVSIPYGSSPSSDNLISGFCVMKIAREGYE